MNNDFFPHRSAVCILQEVHLVKYNNTQVVNI